MLKKPNLFFLIAGIFLINTAGFFLRFYDLDTFFIILGFRFHFSIIIPFLLILNFLDFSYIKKLLVHPAKQKFIPVLLIGFIPLLFIPLDLFLLEKFNLSEKDYFFELGLSSLVDYPVYLAWNIPQLFMLFIVMKTVVTSPNQKFIKLSFLIFFLFLYELLPLIIPENNFSFNTINFISIVTFILSVLTTALFISRINNIYLFSILLFTALWGSVLFFGSSSETVINILLASQYESWDGLINPGKKFEYSNYLQPVYLFILFVVSLIILKKNSDRSTS